MIEQDIQRDIKKKLEARGAVVTKYNANAYGVAGHPDLFCAIPWGAFFFAAYFEVKKPGGKVSPAQKSWMKRMRAKGVWVERVHSIEEVDEYLQSKGVFLFE